MSTCFIDENQSRVYRGEMLQDRLLKFYYNYCVDGTNH